MFNTNVFAPNPFPTGDEKSATTQQKLGQAGQAITKMGLAQNEDLLNQLAQMGPPPQVQMPQAAPVGPGTALVTDNFAKALGGMKAKPPPQTRGEAQTNPSIGSALTGY